MSIKPDDANVLQFVDRVLDNYILEDVLFPPNIWVQCSSALNLTTNGLQKAFQNTYLNIHHFQQLY